MLPSTAKASTTILALIQYEAMLVNNRFRSSMFGVSVSNGHV